MAAERDSTDRYVAAFMEDRVGAQFEARITGVTRFGLFVRLTETGAEGLLPARTLGFEYFRHDEKKHALIGDRTGTKYSLGDYPARAPAGSRPADRRACASNCRRSMTPRRGRAASRSKATEPQEARRGYRLSWPATGANALTHRPAMSASARKCSWRPAFAGRRHSGYAETRRQQRPLRRRRPEDRPRRAAPQGCGHAGAGAPRRGRAARADGPAPWRHGVHGRTNMSSRAGASIPAIPRIAAGGEMRPDVLQKPRTIPPARARPGACRHPRNLRGDRRAGGRARRSASPAPATRPGRRFFAHGIVPRLDALDLIARAITPPNRTRRFDARFFMADADAIAHALDAIENDELLDAVLGHAGRSARARPAPHHARACWTKSKRAREAADPARPVPFFQFLRGKAADRRICERANGSACSPSCRPASPMASAWG